MELYILQLRVKIAELMLKILQLQAPKKSNKRLVLFDIARACIGKDMAPIENEYGCAEAVNAVFKKAFGVPIGGELSTWRMIKFLEDIKRFQRVALPLPGDIIISPTGYGDGRIPNGHVGIVGEDNLIMSNDSASGLWIENYNLYSWKARYQDRGGYPIYYFRVL